jgi:uncharacterized membrane protein
MTDASIGESGARNNDDVRVLAIVIYILMLVSFFNGFTALASVVLAYIKRADARGTIYQGHYSNVIRTFWIALSGVAALCTLTLWVIFGAIGFHGDPVDLVVLHPWMWLFLPFVALAFAMLAVYCLYRMVRGLVRAVEAKPY